MAFSWRARQKRPLSLLGEGVVRIKKKFHATDADRRFSLSAAKVRHARMSSRVSSGKSFKISSAVMPEARYSSTSETVILIPRMQGLPLLFPGSIVMIFEWSM